MSARDKRMYEEALALWQAISDETPPDGDAAALIAAVLNTAPPQTYERITSPWLRAEAITWATYTVAPQRLA